MEFGMVAGSFIGTDHARAVVSARYFYAGFFCPSHHHLQLQKAGQAGTASSDVSVVSGHSHVPKIDTVDCVLYLNPGSAGRRRFRLPVTLATIDVTPANLRPEIHDLGDV